MRVRVRIEGDLCRALVWEARRRGVDAEGFTLSMIRRASARILGNWRAAHEGVLMFERPTPPRWKHSWESVLELAYGPGGQAVRGANTAEQ